MLPGRDGWKLLSTLRKRGTQTPVLVLTAKDAIEERCFRVSTLSGRLPVKPFAFPELTARVEALLRRGKAEAAKSQRIDGSK